MVSSSDSYIPKLTSHLHSDDVAFPSFLMWWLRLVKCFKLHSGGSLVGQCLSPHTEYLVLQHGTPVSLSADRDPCPEIQVCFKALNAPRGLGYSLLYIPFYTSSWLDSSPEVSGLLHCFYGLSSDIMSSLLWTPVIISLVLGMLIICSHFEVISSRMCAALSVPSLVVLTAAALSAKRISVTVIVEGLLVPSPTVHVYSTPTPSFHMATGNHFKTILERSHEH